MAVRNLPTSGARLAGVLGVCETATSRKIAAAEELLSGHVLDAAEKLTESGRKDRVRTCVVGRLRTISAVLRECPEDFDAWIDALIVDRQVSDDGQ